MEPKILGEIDGKQLWWCEACESTAFAAKRNVAPEMKHATDCGKSEPARIPLDDLKASSEK